MTTTKMVRGVMAMLLLVGCGDATTTDNGDPAAPAIEASGSGAPATATTQGEEGREGTNGSAPDAPRPDETADAGAPDAPKPAPLDCSKRTNGALITFNKGAETWTVWSTNEKMNVELFTAALKGTYVQVSFNDIIDGVDCDGQVTWHVDAQDMSLDGDYDAACDALPSEVEANKAEWLKRDQWCPSKVLVSAFQTQ